MIETVRGWVLTKAGGESWRAGTPDCAVVTRRFIKNGHAA